MMAMVALGLAARWHTEGTRDLSAPGSLKSHPEKQPGAHHCGMGRIYPTGMGLAVEFLHSPFSHPSWDHLAP